MRSQVSSSVAPAAQTCTTASASSTLQVEKRGRDIFPTVTERTAGLSFWPEQPVQGSSVMYEMRRLRLRSLLVSVNVRCNRLNTPSHGFSIW